MLISEFEKYVAGSDQYSNLSAEKRLDIGLQGLASEIGSVVSAIKKEALREGGALSSNVAKEELKEELGDVLWYAFAVAQIDEVGSAESLAVSDILGLKSEIFQSGERAQQIQQTLSPELIDSFLILSDEFLALSGPDLDDYQQVAWLTARTHGSTLLTVCAAVMTQLGAQALRHLLPPSELELNQQLRHRPLRRILSEILWHASAIASLYDLHLNEVAAMNEEKNRFRKPDRVPTPLHDEGRPADEQFPRQFEVIIKSKDEKTSTMWLNGEQLGDDLQDNAHQPDGYRFHDVMHLANVAHLGWSPVLRKMMKLKRDTDESLDNVEDGGRAAVVEEAIVKVIHAEGERRARLRQPNVPPDQLELFPKDEEIPFSMLKLIQRLAMGHEVYSNKAWEWESAIRSGYELFQKFRVHKEGKVVIDLNEHQISYEPLKA